jgi:hypothetical protein
VTPSAAEVVVDPPAPTQSVTPPADESAALYPPLDLADHSPADLSNGVHAAATTAEPIEPVAPSEPVRHG